VPGTGVMRKPESLSLEKAAALGVSGCTALVLRVNLEKGDGILVNGASGGVM